MYFKHVQFEKLKEKWCDGGLRRNHRINEALAERPRERSRKEKKVGCVLSLGTGIAEIKAISANLAAFLKGSVDIMTDSEHIPSRRCRTIFYDLH